MALVSWKWKSTELTNQHWINMLVEWSYWPNTAAYHFRHYRQQVPSIQFSQEANLKPRFKCQYPSCNYLDSFRLNTEEGGSCISWMIDPTYKRPLFLYELLKTLPSHNFVGRGQGQRGDPCTVRSNASWVMVTWWPPVNGQTRLKTLPSRNFCWQAVIKGAFTLVDLYSHN